MAKVPPISTNVSSLIEMLGTFLVLAETLNVTHTEQIVGSTRQTIKRHIKALETLRGHALFTVFDKNYSLTDEGIRAIPPATQLILDAANWAKGLNNIGPFIPIYSSYTDQDDYIYLEQKGLGDVFVSATPFMKDCIIAWLRSDGNLSALHEVRKFGMLFRFSGSHWVLTEVGDNASTVSWFGSAWHKSCLGQSVEYLPASNDLDPIIQTSYGSLSEVLSIRLDHICTQFPKFGHVGKVPVSYKRLLLNTTFENGAPALLILAERSHDLRISALPDELRLAMDKDDIMDVSLTIKGKHG